MIQSVKGGRPQPRKDPSDKLDHVETCRADVTRVLALLSRATGYAHAAVVSELGCFALSSGGAEAVPQMPDRIQGCLRSNLGTRGHIEILDPRTGGGIAIGFGGENGTPACVLGIFGPFAAGAAADASLHLEETAAVLASIIGREETIGSQGAFIQEQERELAQSRKVFDRSSAVARIGVWECDLETEALQWTDYVYDIFDLPRGSQIKRDEILTLYSRDSREELHKRRSAAIASQSGFTLDACITTALGNERWIRITATVEPEDGRPARIFGMKQDITEERRLSEKTRYLAEFDMLTGLANRSQFQTRLAATAEKGEGHALLLLDLDGFKQVNDTYGHAAGDICLKEIAARLRDFVAAEAFVARIGGDEFAILTDRPADAHALVEMSERMIARLRKPIYWSDQSFQLGASIGIAIAHPGPQHPADDLFASADMALYAAKTAGKNRHKLFDVAMRKRAEVRLKTIRSIGDALAHGQLLLHYQPKFETSNSRLAGFEALLRWKNPEDGQIVSAGSFQAAFEDPELSQRIGQWVTNEALGQAARWRRAGLQFDHIAVNVSSSQLGERNFSSRLLNQIERLGLQPQMIEVEITEGVFLHDEGGPIFSKLQRLQAAGVGIALDDFGTGYASLVHLRGYPVDTLKIDRSFVQNFLHSKADASIVESIVYLGMRLSKKVIAEGVETREQLERLRSLGCPYGQGFLFSPPLTAAEAEELMHGNAARLPHVA